MQQCGRKGTFILLSTCLPGILRSYHYWNMLDSIKQQGTYVLVHISVAKILNSQCGLNIGIISPTLVKTVFKSMLLRAQICEKFLYFSIDHIHGKSISEVVQAFWHRGYKLPVPGTFFFCFPETNSTSIVNKFGFIICWFIYNDLGSKQNVPCMQGK